MNTIINGTASVENQRIFMPLKSRGKKRRLATYSFDFTKRNRIHTCLQVVEYIGRTIQRGSCSPQELRKIFDIFNFDVTDHDLSAMLSRWRHQRPPQCLRFAPGHLLTLIGATDEPTPQKWYSDYTPGDRIAKKLMMQKKQIVVSVKAKE